jgi:imidazolonepropionase-like amidohydrolase
MSRTDAARKAAFALLFLALLILVFPGALLGQRALSLSPQVRDFVTADEPVIALSGVTVVDGTGAAPAPGQVIVISDGRIAAVGPAASTAVPAGARILDLAGHTVIPGLIGLHNHTFYTTSGRSVQLSYSSPRLYLGTGVTTIRTTGAASPYSELNMKRGIDAGEIPGPRMHVTGPYITGSAAAGSHMSTVNDPDEARRVVAYWAEEGATWFKAYTAISREALGAAIDEAHQRGLRFTGHLCSVSFREAVALGIDNLEHGLFTNSDYDPTKEPDRCPSGMRNRMADLDMDSPPVATTIREMVDNGVALTSTLAVYELSFPGRPPLEPRFERAMAPEAYREYMATRESIERNAESSVMPVVFAKAQQFELQFARAGGLLGAGVDPTGNGGALPGFGDQRNYELLIEAGFTAVEAIRVMSLNGARILGNDADLGSVEAGKIADLVVIRGDPIARPEEIRGVVTVFKDGIAFDAVRLIRSVDGVVGVR